MIETSCSPTQPTTALHGHVRYVAIIGDDTPAFRAERELMQTDRVRLFVDATLAEQWLAAR